MTARRLRLRRREAAVQRTVPPPRAELSRVAAEQDWPRLRVGKGQLYRARLDGRWWWEITGPDADVLDRGTAPSWREALAVGLAALEQASVSGRTSA